LRLKGSVYISSDMYGPDEAPFRAGGEFVIGRGAALRV
jgi:hypothetical protein